MVIFSRLTILLVSIVFCASCTQTAKKSDNEISLTSSESSEAKAATEDEHEIPDKAVQGLRKLIDSVALAIETNETPEDPVEKFRLEKVKFWLNYFTKRDKDRFQRFLNRGQSYREVVQTTLEENEIPNELYYLAMIESGYSTHAYSRASAVGVWQFIRATGQRYGLKSNYYVDERRHPIQATEGATKYLRDLYNAFLSWELAMAAYNTGEFRVFRAIMSSKSRDFWVMAMQRRLPKETRNYVPKFIAAAIIGSQPEKFGFTDPSLDFTPYPSVVAVETPPRVRLKDIARLSGIELKTLKELNPHIRRGVTPPIKGNYEIWVPEEKVSALQDITEKLKKKQVAMRTIDDSPLGNYYRVRKNDTLSHIARKFRMSIRTLKRVNNLRSSRIYPGMKLRTATRVYHRPKAGGSTYVVRSGDSLGVIARRYRTSIRRLKRINNLRSDSIRIGQRLIVNSKGKKSSSVAQHKVRNGETLGKIASKYGLSVRQLKKYNGLRKNVIYVGQILKVENDRGVSSL